MISSITVAVLVFVFVGLGFALGYLYCDYRTTNEIIDHSKRYELLFEVTEEEMKEGNPYAKCDK